ncbi:MAG: BMP family ABC transporter substrate-binding protein [Clostridia bacterium]|nr:BMP family ABC transporter substrate-binding protein [Clostridia bacterium]
MSIFEKGLEDVYLSARKRGLDEVERLERQDRYPFLRDLDTITKGVKIISQVSLGIIDVPLRQITGTYTKMRGNSFSRSFMPLLDPKSEFAHKWTNVYDIQLSEGLRDPIKAYEFLNRIYVIEGNKRVSVLKYCGAFSFPAMVTRLMPQRDESSLTNRIYYASLDFYKLAGYNAIWFSKPEKYGKLINLIEKSKDKFIADNPYHYVAFSLYEKFRELYLAYGGRSLPITTADAFLYFSTINGFEDATHTEKYRNTVKRYISTLASVASDNIDEYVTVDIPATSGGRPPRRRRNNLNVAFVYQDDAAQGWSMYHKKAQDMVQEKYEKQINTKSYYDVSFRSANYDQMRKIVKDNDVIFATSPVYHKNMLRASLHYSRKSLFLCSSFSKFEYLETYYGRCYEQAFILGAVAASVSNKSEFAFLTSRMLPSALMSLNAFTLGLRMIKDDARVRLITRTSTLQDENEYNETIINELKKTDCDVCYNTSFCSGEACMFGGMGLYHMKKTGWENIATPIWNWEEFYDTMIEDILSTRFGAGHSILPEKTQRLNYWWGLDTGMLDIEISDSLSEDTKRLVKFLKNGIIAKVAFPFEGPVYDKTGKLRIMENETARMSDIIEMNWIAEGITANISDDKLKSYIEIYNGTEVLTN